MNNNYSGRVILEDLFPEIYIMVYPHVREAVNEMTRRNLSPTPERINQVIDDIIRTCGMWDEDDMPNLAAQQQPFHPSNRNRRGHHNRNTLRDVIRIVLLRELLQR